MVFLSFILSISVSLFLTHSFLQSNFFTLFVSLPDSLLSLSSLSFSLTPHTFCHFSLSLSLSLFLFLSLTLSFRPMSQQRDDLQQKLLIFYYIFSNRSNFNFSHQQQFLRWLQKFAAAKNVFTLFRTTLSEATVAIDRKTNRNVILGHLEGLSMTFLHKEQSSGLHF